MQFKKILLSDESFHQSFLSSYRAIVLLDHYQFTCTFLDATRKKFIYFYTHHSITPFSPNEIEHLFRQHHLHQNDLQKYILYTSNAIYSFPESFSNNLFTNLPQNIFFTTPTAIIKKSLFNIHLYFQPPQEYHSYVSQLKHVEFLPHIHHLLIQASFYLQKIKSNNTIHIHLHPKSFEIICFKDKKPYLINTFPYSTEDDVLYYIHTAIQSLSLSKEDTCLLFSGNIEKNDHLLKKCKEFNFKYDLSNFNKNYIYSYRLNELKAHQYSTLFYLTHENY